jgi:alkylhydroperoxidase/carboxymuconolactone decarboxylase family protein YurZ
MERLHEKRKTRKQLDGKIAQSPMKVFGALREAGRHVFADGALTKKQKELMALAVAISQNCFD